MYTLCHSYIFRHCFNFCHSTTLSHRKSVLKHPINMTPNSGFVRSADFLPYVMFDIHEPNAFRKCSTWWVLEKSEEPCRFLNKFVHACARCQCNSCKSVAWFCSLFWTLNESELWMYIGRIAPNLKNLENWVCNSPWWILELLTELINLQKN